MSKKDERMTMRRALHELIMCARRDCTGAGCGMRGVPEGEARERIVKAVQKAWPKAYGVEMTEHEVHSFRHF